ncbi:MAG: hypothetical protein AB1457_00510 [Chloroflexota bacterium]
MTSAAKTVSQIRIKPVHIPVLLVFLPRVDLIISIIVMIGGLLLPLLMILGILSATLWLGFLSFGMLAAGGTLFAVFIGEIR